MAVTSTPVFVQNPDTNITVIQPADALNLKTIYTAGANGALLTNILITLDATAAASTLSLWRTISGIDFLIGTFNIPVNSGFTTGVAPVFPLRTSQMGFSTTTGVSSGNCVDNTGNPYLKLEPSELLKAKVAVAVATAKTLTIVCEGSQF